MRRLKVQDLERRLDGRRSQANGDWQDSLNNDMVARGVKGNTVVRFTHTGRVTKLNTTFITVPTKAIVRIKFLRMIATIPEGAVAKPVKPKADTSSATTERLLGEGESAGVGLPQEHQQEESLK
jgi:hypothetical protein